MKLLCFLTGLGILSLTTLHAATPGGGAPAAEKIKLEPPSYWAPLKYKEGVPTEKSQREDEIRWFEKHLIPAISKSWQGEPWKDKALAFVRERLPRFQNYFKWEARPIPKTTPKELADAGCTDPWIRLLAAADYRNSTPDELWSAFDVIRDSGIDHALLRFAALPLLQNGSPLSGDRRSIALEIFSSWTADLGASKCYTKADDHLLFRHIRKLPAFRLDQSDFEITLKQGTSLPSGSSTPWRERRPSTAPGKAAAVAGPILSAKMDGRDSTKSWRLPASTSSPPGRPGRINRTPPRS